MSTTTVILFFFFFFFSSLLSSNSSISSISFACKPPHHNSYRFCDASLPIKARAHSLISLLTLDEKIQQLSDNASGIPRLGIPNYEWWSESLHGIATNGPGISFRGPIPSATSFPQVILTAASFNKSLWSALASAIGVEARAMFNSGQAGLTFWAPNINIFRDPRWGRGQETPGEDPLLTSDYAVHYVRGFQAQHPAGNSDHNLILSACCKHFTAYDLDKWGQFTRYNFNAVVTKQDMEDTYQPPFVNCIQRGKASCLMCSYNRVNGIPACADQKLLEKARNEWGFNGYITSDCDAVATIYEDQNYTRTPEDAVSIALAAGTNINCGTYMLRHVKSAIDQGKVTEKDIDKALLYLFSVQLRLGLFDGDPAKGRFGKLGPEHVCTSKHKALALEAARQGIVLLKNDNKFLPLDKNKVSSLAVIGPMANTSNLGGGYSGFPCNRKTILDGLQEYVKTTMYEAGCQDVPCNSSAGFQKAISISREAEYVVVVAGLDLSQETEDLDRYSLLLPGYQTSLVSSLAAVSQKPLVLVLTGGGPIDVSFSERDPRIASIIWIGYPGETGGRALSEIIFGDYNPGGRLPMTWYPESFMKIPMTDMSMRADPSRSYPGRTYRFYTGDKVYGFGHGKSYSTFTYRITSAPDEISLVGAVKAAEAHDDHMNILHQGNNELDYIHVDEIADCKSLRFYVNISVMNEGDMDGDQVVLLFSRIPERCSRNAPERQLIGYDRVHCEAHASCGTSILVDPCQHLSIVNEDGHRILPLGLHILMLEDHIKHIVLVDHDQGYLQ